MCGEKFLSDSDFDFRHFLFHHVPHEVMHWDGKLGLTLRELILVPGKTAANYVHGRRQRYLNPLRLYLVVFVVQAFLSGIGIRMLTLGDSLQRYDPTGIVANVIVRLNKTDLAVLNRTPHHSSSAHWLSECGTLVVFLLLARVQMLLLGKYHRRYLEHVMLSLNVATFAMLVLIVGDIVTLIAGRGSISDVAEGYRLNALAFALPIYWLFAIRHFYGTTWRGAVFYSVAITAANVVIATVINMLALVLLAETS